MAGFVNKWIVKPFLEKHNIKLCEICDDALAKTSMDLCEQCQQVIDEDMHLRYLQDMREAYQ